LTGVVPIALSVLFLIWFGILTSGQTVAGVALLTCFPFLQVLWGLRDRPLLCRILLAIDDALPFGFVAMLFGEAMSSVAGLGFLMMSMHTDERLTDEGLAAAILTVALLIILSGTLRFVVRWSQIVQPTDLQKW
jgi:ABC-type nitrate/sulfonate/bicarbonate transport system permease component